MPTWQEPPDKVKNPSSHTWVCLNQPSMSNRVSWVILYQWFTSRSGPSQGDFAWCGKLDNEPQSSLRSRLYSNLGLESGLICDNLPILIWWGWHCQALPSSPWMVRQWSKPPTTDWKRPSHPAHLWTNLYPREVGIKKHHSKVVKLNLKSLSLLFQPWPWNLRLYPPCYPIQVIRSVPESHI